MQARVITALVTPFSEGGEVDFKALRQLIAFQIKGATEGILFCGSTGEGGLLSFEEKRAIFHHGVEQAKGVVDIIASVGGCSTRECVCLAEDAKRLGVDALIAIVPYYVKPTPEGCVCHFRAIAQVGLPLIVYHHPARTGTLLSQAALLEIAQIKGVVGVKEASGDLDLVTALAQHGVAVYSGDDTLCASHLKRGAVGSISVCGNLLPKEWKQAVEARAISPHILKLCCALTLETNPQCVKYAASAIGLCSPKVRLPLLEPHTTTKGVIKEALQTVGLAWR